MCQSNPAPWVVLAAFLSCPSIAWAQIPPEPEPLTEQFVAHTPSRMRGMTSTVDGKWMFQSEGGTMVFILTHDGMSYTDVGFKKIDGEKRVPMGRKQVIASRVILDPGADTEPGPVTSTSPNLLYLAAGRDGLWMMEADVDTSVENAAWRVDDSGNITDVTTQNSRRWCSAVATMTVEGNEYLLALFARKGQSRLRVYPLDLVRAIADPSAGNPELDSEILPALQVNLGVHPNAPPGSAKTYGRSVSLNMDVDQFDDVPGQESADVYVAMGHHGLLKVAFQGPPLQGTVTWGPIFGTGSSYEAPGGVAVPAGKSRALYGNLLLEHVKPYLDPPFAVDRSEFPVFTDAAVYRGTVGSVPVHHLYASVDHLFWVCFDLANQVFDEAMPIFHHEGEEFTKTVMPGATPWHLVRPISDPSWEKAGCARALGVVEHPIEGPYLFVTNSKRSLTNDYKIYTTEGIEYDSEFHWGGAVAAVPSADQTFWYKIQATYSDSPPINSVGHVDIGGEDIYVPPGQEINDQIKFFHNYWVEFSDPPGFPDPGPPQFGSGAALSLVPADVGDPDPVTYARSNKDGRGRQTFDAITSLLDPDLILTGGNDGGVPSDGFLVTHLNPSTGEYEIIRWYSPAPGGNFDERGPNGFLLDSEAQWQEPGQPQDQYYYFGTGKNRAANPDDYASVKRWLLLELKVPADLSLNGPEREGWWYVIPPEDGFENRGRLYVMSGYMSPAFDTFLADEQLPERHLFATRIRTAEGLTVFDRGEFLTEALAQPDGAEIVLDDLGVNVLFENLVTHPEFNNMQRDDAYSLHADLETFWQGPNDDNSAVFSYSPKVIEVQVPDTSTFGRWVLVLPCGSIRADPDWDIYDTEPLWKPNTGSIWETEFTHGFVQFWEMVPDGLGSRYWPETYTYLGRDGVPGTEDDVLHNSKLRKIVVPHSDTNIWRVEPLRMTVNNVERVFLFCLDFGGHVYVYSIEDILDVSFDPDGTLDNNNPNVLIESWESPGGLFDALKPSAAMDMAIDYRGGQLAWIIHEG